MKVFKSSKERTCTGCEKPIKKGQKVWYVSKYLNFFCSPSCSTLYANRRDEFELDTFFWDEMDFYKEGRS